MEMHIYNTSDVCSKSTEVYIMKQTSIVSSLRIHQKNTFHLCRIDQQSIVEIKSIKIKF